MKSAEIRDAFINYFADQQHKPLPSSSLVPGNDPTLLFTNAGMVQFKDVFIGAEQRDYQRAVTSQRCVRAGGKHNDLENVGYTARHHTFFEMLGNFSFGDYFKREAINYAWEFLTGVLKLPKERLWVTVHISDDEAADIWVNEIGVDPERLSRLDEDNFWQMGDTGPCGPSTEIFWDHGEDVPGGPPGSVDDDLDRYIEIWNLVFMQFERDAAGNMEPLPKPSIDTGMGLERVAAVMQGVHSNYDIDLFQHLIGAAARETGCGDMGNDSLKVIADHIRSCSFLIIDGVLPSNEGRGYVLRRIIRRALRHGHKLGKSTPFFHALVADLAEIMGDAYPELRSRLDQISAVLRKEEEQFARTLDNGMGVLEAALANLDGDVIPGDVVFQLYDTYGFPTDLTNDVAREKGFTLDMPGYEQCMEAQRQRARSASQFGVDYTEGLQLDGETTFTGYDTLQQRAQVVAIVSDGQRLESVEGEQDVVVVLDSSPFYAESGGQVGDCGFISTAEALIEIRDCRKSGDHHLHIGRMLRGQIAVGQMVEVAVDADLRSATAANHSATHLLHEALRKVLGDHVEQQGSMVDSQRLRFDFSHSEAVSAAQLREIEHIVNAEIRRNLATTTELMDMDSAVAKGATALFGEKYGDQVRVLSVGGDFSVELCGGTHVARAGDIGMMRLTAESSVASGVRRIEGVTGVQAEKLMDQYQDVIADVARAANSDRSKVVEKVEKLSADNRQLHKQIDQLKAKLAGSSGTDLMAGIRDIKGVKVLATQVEGADAKSLRSVADQVRSKIGSGIFLLATVDGHRAPLVAGVTSDLVGRVKAGDLIKYVAEQTGGKGGGRADMAQGAAGDSTLLAAALDSVYSWVEGNLGE